MKINDIKHADRKIANHMLLKECLTETLVPTKACEMDRK